MAENNNTENSNIAEILQAIINGSSDYPDFKDNPPSRIALLLMLLGNDISAIKEIVENLPNPMVFKGTLGTGGDIESLPAPSEDNNGFTYIVITSGTYAQQPAKFGDLFTSTGTSWSYVPSGDDYVIDDSVTSTALTWSSNKIANELDGVVKSLTYIGDGALSREIEFPTIPKIILSIKGTSFDGAYIITTSPFGWNNQGFIPIFTTTVSTGSIALSATDTVTFNGNKMTITNSNSAGRAFNYLNEETTIYYI